MGFYGQRWRAMVERDLGRAFVAGGYEAWLRGEAVDALRAEMGPEAFDAMEEAARGVLVVARARRIRLAKTRPTEAQLVAWWVAQPEKEYRCERCGKTGEKPYVQPQHPFFAEGREGVARCAECVAEMNAERRRARRRA